MDGENGAEGVFQRKKMACSKEYSQVSRAFV